MSIPVTFVMCFESFECEKVISPEFEVADCFV